MQVKPYIMNKASLGHVDGGSEEMQPVGRVAYFCNDVKNNCES